MTKFSIVLEPDDNGTFLVSFPDLPEAHTFGETQDDALAHAVDALVTALEARIADRDPIPNPAPVAPGRPFVVVPPLVDAKVYLYRTMRQQHITKAQLAKRLNVHPPQVDRLLDLRHQSRFDHLETAFRQVGYSLYVQIAKTVQPSWVIPRPPAKTTPARRRTTAAGSRKR
jgi:antitoxin HicB